MKHAKKAAEEHRSLWIFLALFTHLHHGNLFQIIKDNLVTGRTEVIANLNMYIGLQYVALGPRVKVIILNILPELKLDGLKFSLKIDLMSLAIIAK